jgi:hypothetical protein
VPTQGYLYFFVDAAITEGNLEAAIRLRLPETTSQQIDRWLGGMFGIQPAADEDLDAFKSFAARRQSAC